ncbi:MULTISPECIES: hypothetical protein [unclassified Microcoleus]|uniref:hypothetical protein n=1 Tax=unclassified Microcoleus TaxID=2642155 RepID=UPI002FD58884
MKRVKVKFSLVWLLIVVFCLSNSHSVYAETLDRFSSPNSFQIKDLSSIIKIGAPIALEELGLEDWNQTPKSTPTQNQLLRLSIRLRDIARYLGPTWPIVVAIPDAKTENNGTESDSHAKRKITDFRTIDGNWITLTSGHALRMVARELEILKTSSKQPSVDFLVNDEVTDSYRPLLNVPLVQYCSAILKLFEL